MVRSLRERTNWRSTSRHVAPRTVQIVVSQQDWTILHAYAGRRFGCGYSGGMWLPRLNYAPPLTLTGIIFLALVMRLWNIRESLWVDELHTAWCALAGLDEVAQRAALGNQSPDFFWLEWLLVRVFGFSEPVLRLPSLLAGTALIAAVYLFARQYASAGAGLVAAAMLAVDPMAIFYSTEARPYALVQLLAVVHVWLALEVRKRPTWRRRLAWVALAGLLFHLHYTTALLLAAEVVLFGVMNVRQRGQAGYRWRLMLVDVGIAALLCLPAIGNVSEIFGRRGNWVFVASAWPWAVFEWWPAGMGLVLLATAAATGHSLNKRVDFLTALFCWFAVPALLAWAATRTNVARLFFPRYLVAIQPAAALLGAWCIDLAPWRWSRRLVAALLVGAAVWSSGIVERLVERGLVIEPREDWRRAVAWLNQARENQPLPVIVASGLIELKELALQPSEALEAYCLYPVSSLYPLDAHANEMAALAVDESGRISQPVEMLAVHRGGAWLVIRGDRRTGERVAGSFTAYLQASIAPGSNMYWRIGQRQSFRGVQVVLVEIEEK